MYVGGEEEEEREKEKKKIYYLLLSPLSLSLHPPATIYIHSPFKYNLPFYLVSPPFPLSLYLSLFLSPSLYPSIPPSKQRERNIQVQRERRRKRERKKEREGKEHYKHTYLPREEIPPSSRIYTHNTHSSVDRWSAPVLFKKPEAPLETSPREYRDHIQGGLYYPPYPLNRGSSPPAPSWFFFPVPSL